VRETRWRGCGWECEGREGGVREEGRKETATGTDKKERASFSLNIRMFFSVRWETMRVQKHEPW
jgi:hypothetical protein